MTSFANKYSSIFIEDEALSYPLTSHVLDSFPNSEIIPINNYKDIFFRKSQSFELQKKSQSLILAVKKDPFIYSSSKFAQSCGYKNFYYASLALNCIYDCEYCYLQGMHPSANIVAYVNIDDCYAEVKQLTQCLERAEEIIFLSLSYDTDLLASESIIPYCKSWVSITQRNKSLLTEIRTKSANWKPLTKIKPSPNILLSWTFSPQNIINKHEPLTPSLKNRIKAAHTLANKGWRVRFCFDPIFFSDDWQKDYEECVNQVFHNFPITQLNDITIGSFRMSSVHLRNSRKNRPGTHLLHQDWHTNQNIASEYPDHQIQMNNFMHKILSNWVSPTKISWWN